MKVEGIVDTRDDNTSDIESSPFEGNRKRKQGQRAAFRILSMVAHFVVCLFTGFMVYSASPGSSLFSWHPTLMTIGACLFLTEGILVFSPQSSLVMRLKHQNKKTLHWLIMDLGVISMVAGACIIYYNKNLNSYPHFTSWHGKLGLVTVVFLILQSMGGLTVYFHSYFKFLGALADTKMYHATSGLLTFSMVCGSLALAMFSSWFTSTVTGTAWYACIACPSVLALTVMTQVTAAYAQKIKPRK